MIEKHERQRKQEHTLNGERRGTDAAALDARGAALGSIGLMSFALIVWLLAPRYGLLALVAAAVVWLFVSVAVWRLRRAASRYPDRRRVWANYVVLPLFGFQVKLSESFAITLIFMVISIIRSYLIRRFLCLVRRVVSVHEVPDMRCDMRPQRYGWASGGYMCRCQGVGCKDKNRDDQLFIGDKRATMCSECAYALPDPVPVDVVGRHVDVIIADNPDKWEQAVERPQLLGWFVGQTMKRLKRSGRSRRGLCQGLRESVGA